MPETICAQTAFLSTKHTCSYPSVSADDLGFALNVFVAASNRRLTIPHSAVDSLSEEELIERQHLFAGLIVHGIVPDHGKTLPYQASLGEAFAAVWHEYRTHELRDALCARVLCFHFLMEQTEGKAVAAWTNSCEEQPEVVTLDPSVVEGLAYVPLQSGTGLNEEDLLTAIGRAHKARLPV